MTAGRHHSILRVLAWRLLAVSVVFLALIVVTLQSRIRDAANSLFHEALEEDAREIGTHLKVGTDGKIALSLADSSDAASALLHYRVLDGQGHLLITTKGPVPPAESLGLPPAAWPKGQGAGDGGPIAFSTIGPPQFPNRLMLASLPLLVDGKPVYVQVFENLDQRGVLMDDFVEQFFADVGWLVIPFLALLFVTNLATIWAQLRPLTKLSRLAAEIGPETLGHRLPEEGQPRETLPLIRSVNRAFERLEQAFEVQRQFTADAAHELRTPLAVLSAHIDTLADKGSAMALRQEVAGMSRLVGQLLRIAELDALDHAPDNLVDLHALAIDVASSLAPLALKEKKSIALAGKAGPAWVRGDGEALHQALRNLVENALSHTPRGTTVEINLTADGRLEVTDEGPGVPAEMRDKVFQRFFRADRRTDGAGLGLAIVAKVAETHGGHVRVENAPQGGARFVLELPPSAAPQLGAMPVEAAGARDIRPTGRYDRQAGRSR